MSVMLDYYYGMQGRPAAAYPTQDPNVYEQHLFFVGVNGQLIHSWWDGYTGVMWQSEELPTNSPPGSDPIAMPVQTLSGSWELHVHVRGSDDSLQYLRYDGSVWAAPETVSGAAVAAPPPAWNGGSSGRSLAGTNCRGSTGIQQHIFYLGTDGVLHDRSWDGSNWGLQSLPGPIAGPPSAVCLAPTVGGPLAVFFTGTDGALHWTQSDDGATWFLMPPLPGQPISPPVAMFPPPIIPTPPYQQTKVHYRAYSPDGLWRTYFDGSQYLAESLASPPGIVGDPVTTFNSIPTFKERVFYMGSDLTSLRELYFTYDGDGNRTGFAFEEPPGTPVRLIGLADFDDGPHIFFVAADGSLQQTWGDDGNWMNQTLPAYSPPTSYPLPQTNGCNIPAVLSAKARQAVRAIRFR